MIYTVTLNPALDYVMRLPQLRQGEVNRAHSEEIQLGGKGINVSRVLSELGEASTALGFLAGFTGDALQQGAPGRGRHIAPHAVDGQRRQQQRPQQHARTIEKGRANQICPGALRHKRRPPYHGRQQKQKIAPRFSCLHTISPFALLFCHTQKMQKLKLHKK